MRTYKTELKKVVDTIFCDSCGENCTKEYATLDAVWGYYSKQDGTKYCIEICETCFNEVLQLIQRISLSRSDKIHKQCVSDPLKGKSYFPL